MHTRRDGAVGRRGWTGNIDDCAIFDWRGRDHLFRMKFAQLYRRCYRLLWKDETMSYLISKRFEVAILSGHANLPVLRKASPDDEFLCKIVRIERVESWSYDDTPREADCGPDLCL